MKKLERKIEKFLTKRGYENVTFNKSTKYSSEEYIEVRADYVTPAWTWDKPTKTFDDEFGKITIEEGTHYPETRDNNDIFRIYSRGKVDGRNTYHITWAGVSDVMKYHLDSYGGTREVFDEFYYNTFENIENYDQESADILAV
tara:strand:- start:115 stop:543 length:429 start_codon:yes stop_codon:yes gene_type:complete